MFVRKTVRVVGSLDSFAVRKAWSESFSRTRNRGEARRRSESLFPRNVCCLFRPLFVVKNKKLFLRIAALYLLSYNARFDMISKKNKQITIDEYNNPPSVLPVDAYDRWSKGSIVVRPSSRLFVWNPSDGGKVAAVVAAPTPKSEKYKPAALNMAEIVKRKLR